MNKKVFLRTFGCQMNIRDSEFVAGLLLDSGFRLANAVDKADIVLFNSCSVRRHAEDRLISNIAELGKAKKKRPALIIGLMGCTAQNYKDAMLKKLPVLDFICGPGNEADIPGIIADIMEHRCPIVATDKVDTKRPELFPRYREQRFKAYVSISEGCDNYCSYCVVPYVRGLERSRDLKDILREVKGLAERGFKEVTLLGQNVNSYGKGRKPKTENRKPAFIQLLEQLNGIKGIERIRFMTSHPKDASEELFRAMRDLDKVCEHLHLPLQSGSDRVLRLMNRKYARKKYLKLVDDYRRMLPDGSITTDIIVGYPSESDADFRDTVDIVRRVRFDGAFTFKYSPRPPARSTRLKDDVPKAVKEERLKVLMDLQCAISLGRNELWKGRTVEVLVDGSCEEPLGFLNGRTRTNKVVTIRGPKALMGRSVKVHVEGVSPHALKGRIV